MSKLDDLIKQLCPDGVEYKKLSTICDFYSGFSFKASLFKKDGLPICKTTNIQNDLINFNDMECFTLNDYNEDLSKYIIYPNSIVIGMSGTIKIGMNKSNKICYLNQRVGMFKPKSIINNSFLYYYLLNIIDSLVEKINGGSVKNLSNNDINNLDILVPPIEVQCEIVKILDNFTELTAGLSAELTARKKQYEYYRDNLLNFNLNVTYKKLGELFVFKNGLSKGKECFGRGVPFIRFTDVYNNRSITKNIIKEYVECSSEEINKLKVKRGDVLFTRTSETAEDVGIASVVLDEIENCVFNGFSIKATPICDDLLPEYCKYCFSTKDFRNYVTQKCSFTTRASLTASTISEYKIAIPSRDIQQRIVNVLDNFDKICSDLNIGIPAEIEARKKQYEYYRELLLTMPEKGLHLDRQTDRQTDRR